MNLHEIAAIGGTMEDTTFKAEIDVEGILYQIRELAYEYGGYNAEDYAEKLYQASCDHEVYRELEDGLNEAYRAWEKKHGLEPTFDRAWEEE